MNLTSVIPPVSWYQTSGFTYENRARLEYLDGMRGIAVMVVFIMHVTEVFVRLTPSGRSIYQAFYDLNLGRVGVVTFFAVSGFLVPSSLFGKPWSGSSRFLIARVFRLYPAYLLSIIPSVLTYQLMTQGQHISPQDALLNLTMVPRLFGAPMANGAYWTLEVELAFYAVCLFLFLGGVLSNSFVLAALMAGLFFLFYTSQRQLWGGLLNPSLSGDAFFFSLHLACMFWGAVIRRWWSGERLNAITYILVGMFSSYWLILLPAELLVTTLHPAFGHMDSRLVFGYSLGLWLFVIGMSIIRIRMRAVIWFGRISYSFYLLHQAGLYVVYWLVLTLPVLQGLPMPLYVLAALACSTGLAAASFSLVEAPFVRLGRALTARLSRSPSHPPLTC